MISNSDLGLLLKFVDKQYVESTLDGDFYFSLSGKFIDMEKKQLDKGIGDSREGSWSRHMKENSVLMIGTLDGEKYPLNVKSATFYQTYEILRNTPILSFTYLKLEKDFIKDGDKYTLKDEVLDNLLEQFPNRDVIIFSFNDFITQLDEVFLQKEYSFKRNLITYYDEKKARHPLEFDKYESNPFLGLFYKRRFFEFQREYRVAITDFYNEDLTISIGDIRNMSDVRKAENLRGLQLQVVKD